MAIKYQRSQDVPGVVNTLNSAFEGLFEEVGASEAEALATLDALGPARERAKARDDLRATIRAEVGIGTDRGLR